MILHVYALRDRKVGCYGRPLYENLDQKSVVETFRRSIVGNPAQSFNLIDCELYYLGTFDDNNCSFVLKDRPEFVEDLSQFFPREDKADGK